MNLDCIYILNLDRLKYRYDEVLNRLNSIGINKKNQKIIRWSAIDGSKDLPYSKEIYSSEYENKHDYLKKMNETLQKYNYLSKKINEQIFMKPGQIGCYYSFIQIIKDAKNNMYERILILEDDVYFTSDFKEKLNKLLYKKNDIIYLGNSHRYWNNKNSINSFYCPEKNSKENKNLVEYPLGCLARNEERNNSFLGNFGIVLNKSAFDTILEYAYPMRYPIDVYFGKLYFNNLLNVAFLKNHIVYVDYKEGITHTSSLLKNGTKYKEYH